MNKRLPNPLSALFVAAAVGVAFGGYYGLLCTRGIRMENAGLGIGRAPDGMEVQRNPLSLFEVTEYVTGRSADGRPLSGGVKIGEMALFKVFRGLAASEGRRAVCYSADKKIQLVEYDTDSEKGIDKSRIVLNTGKCAFEYEDLDLDGILDVMWQDMAGETAEYYVLIDNTWTPAVPCAEGGALVRGDFFGFSDGVWNLLIDL